MPKQFQMELFFIPNKERSPMTRLGSEFLKALDSYERPFLGYMTLRQWILLFGIGLTVVVTSIFFGLKHPLWFAMALVLWY